MIAVLISIRPKWCEKIISGEKTIEVRKTRPKMDTPFKCYDELMVMLRAGIISDLRLQPQFTLQESYITETGERIRAVRYTADFSYKFGGKLVVEDVKSTPTRTKEYLRNRKFMRSKFGIDIQEI